LARDLRSGFSLAPPARELLPACDRLYLTVGFRQFSHAFTEIQLALRRAMWQVRACA
jgi:hypothetical protein